MEIYVIRRLVGMARMLSVRGAQRVRLCWRVGLVCADKAPGAGVSVEGGVGLRCWRLLRPTSSDVSLSELVKRVGEIDSRQ